MHTFVDKFVKDGYVLGLGTGSMAMMAIQYIGEKIKEGELKNIIGVATSDVSANEASFCGVPTRVSADFEKIDLSFTDVDDLDISQKDKYPFIYGR